MNLPILEHLGRLLHVTQDLLCVIGFDGNFRFLNSSWESILGYSHGELLGRSYIELIHPDDRAGTLDDAQKVMAGMPTTGFENRQQSKDGSYRWFSWAVVASPSEQLVYAAGRDITEYKSAEERILRLAQAVESSTQLIMLGGKGGRISFVNQALLQATGFEENDLLGKQFRDTLSSPNNRPDQDDEIATQLQRDGAWRGECLCRRKDGTDFPIFLNIGVVRNSEGVVVGSFAMAEDITERQQLETQLRQAQKMEAVGQLAGGVAHDFNNLLMVIMGYAGLLTERLDTSDPMRKTAEEIAKAGRRAATLTRQLLAFSRQQVLEPRVVNLNAIVTDVNEMLARLIGENIELSTALHPGLGQVKVDRGQIEQVIVNLAVNARDAMPEGGRLVIETANVEVDDVYARQHLPMSPGSFVTLTVSDTGVGMDSTTKARIFEPFFTTKERGKGTGLGLATVYGVLKQSGGFIWVYSELGHGTSFKLLLPRVEATREAVVPRVSPDGVGFGSETILLVEDEEAVRKLISRLLAEQGYTVLEASNGTEASLIARKTLNKIHLLMTDVVMPGMGGTQVADLIASLQPGVKMLYMSGYTEFAARREFSLSQERLLLQKPFTAKDLLLKVREALETQTERAEPQIVQRVL